MAASSWTVGRARAWVESARRLGLPGLLLLGLASFTLMTTVIVASRLAGSMQSLEADWIKPFVLDVVVDDTNQTFEDYLLKSPDELVRAIDRLGENLDQVQSQPSTTRSLTILNVEVRTATGGEIKDQHGHTATWPRPPQMAAEPVKNGAVHTQSANASPADPGETNEPPPFEFPVFSNDDQTTASKNRVPPVKLTVKYRPERGFGQSFAIHKNQARAAKWAFAALGLFAWVCLIYMALHAADLYEKGVADAAREAEKRMADAAREAIFDLASRTVHELGTVVYVGANDGENLKSHFAKVNRFLDIEPDIALRRQRTPGSSRSSSLRSIGRCDGNTGTEIDPEQDLRRSASLGLEASRRMSVRNKYVALTVRDLTNILSESTRPSPRCRRMWSSA